VCVFVFARTVCGTSQKFPVEFPFISWPKRLLFSLFAVVVTAAITVIATALAPCSLLLGPEVLTSCHPSSCHQVPKMAANRRGACDGYGLFVQMSWRPLHCPWGGEMQMIVLALAGSMSAAQQGHRKSPKDTSVCPAHTHTPTNTRINCSLRTRVKVSETASPDLVHLPSFNGQ